MPSRARAAIPPAPRKTLLEWIDLDDGHTTGTTQPTCSAELRALHASILITSSYETRGQPEPIEPPPGLRLAPLG